MVVSRSRVADRMDSKVLAAINQRLTTSGERPTTNDQRLMTIPLKVDDHDGLKGLGLSVADIWPIAPLLDGLDGGGCQGGVSFHQSNVLNLAVFIDDFFETNGSFRSARFDGVLRRNALRQPLFRTLGRENDDATFSREWSASGSRDGGARLVGLNLGLRLGGDRNRCFRGCGEWRRNCRA